MSKIQEAKKLLKQYFGYDEFRQGQEQLIEAALNGQDVLGIMPTGAGKSLCFQIPALMMDGITLVISPLISLMKDQVGTLNQAGIHAAWSLSRMVKHIASIDELFETCDYITIHVPYMDSTKGMINKEAIDKMKDGVTLLNFARGELVDNQAVIEGLASGKVKHYVTDFPSAEIAGVDKVITIPHLGASTEESEENCAEMAVDQLMNYLENGNIVNSVNYPNCDLGEASGAARITVHHKNLPNMIGQLTAILAADGHNISNMLNKSKGEWAYSMFDMEKKAPTEETIKKMEQIDGVVRVRVL